MPDFIYAPPQHPRLNIIYQDEAIIVLNKPSGLLSVPGRLPEHTESIASRVQELFPAATIVHRLDMCTSGVILMALTKSAQSHISRQFQQRSTAKYYYARLEGIPTAESGSIDLPLRCDWPNRPRQLVDFVEGKPALKHWQIIAKQKKRSVYFLFKIRREPLCGILNNIIAGFVRVNISVTVGRIGKLIKEVDLQ